MTGKSANPSVARLILWALMDAPRPLFLSEIVSALGGEYPGPYIMPTLIWLMSQGRVGAKIMDKPGKGPKQARAYYFKAPLDLLNQDLTLEQP